MPDLHFRISRHDEVSSTNTLLLEYARKGEPEGLVITAEHQSEGRGKPGRTWVSPRGKNLLFSLLLRPPLKANQLPIVTQMACRSVAAALESFCGLGAEFKRPNDLLIKGKKICGILTEGSSRASGDTEAVVIGIGLNVNAAPGELPEGATSVFVETGKEWDRERLLDQALDRIAQDFGERLYAARS